MAIGDINSGFMGIADIGSIGTFRFQDSSLALQQEVNAPDLVMGDYNRDAWNYGPITVGGSISGPISENFGTGGLWNWAWNRGNCGDLSSFDGTVYFYCPRGSVANSSLTLTGLLVNSLQISCSAGEVATFSLDVLGTGGSYSNGTPPTYTVAEKLVTWDKVGVTITGPGGGSSVDFSNFDVTINNNLSQQYALSQPDLFPFDIVPGLRSITGTLTAYNAEGGTQNDAFDDYAATDVATISINLGGTGTIDFKAALHRLAPSINPGVVTSSVGFTGVTSQ